MRTEIIYDSSNIEEELSNIDCDFPILLKVNLNINKNNYFNFITDNDILFHFCALFIIKQLMDKIPYDETNIIFKKIHKIIDLINTNTNITDKYDDTYIVFTIFNIIYNYHYHFNGDETGKIYYHKLLYEYKKNENVTSNVILEIMYNLLLSLNFELNDINEIAVNKYKTINDLFNLSCNTTPSLIKQLNKKTSNDINIDETKKSSDELSKYLNNTLHPSVDLTSSSILNSRNPIPDLTNPGRLIYYTKYETYPKSTTTELTHAFKVIKYDVSKFDNLINDIEGIFDNIKLSFGTNKLSFKTISDFSIKTKNLYTIALDIVKHSKQLLKASLISQGEAEALTIIANEEFNRVPSVRSLASKTIVDNALTNATNTVKVTQDLMYDKIKEYAKNLMMSADKYESKHKYLILNENVNILKKTSSSLLNNSYSYTAFSKYNIKNTYDIINKLNYYMNIANNDSELSSEITYAITQEQLVKIYENIINYNIYVFKDLIFKKDINIKIDYDMIFNFINKYSNTNLNVINDLNNYYTITINSNYGLLDDILIQSYVIGKLNNNLELFKFNILLSSTYIIIVKGHELLYIDVDLNVKYSTTIDKGEEIKYLTKFILKYDEIINIINIITQKNDNYHNNIFLKNIQHMLYNIYSHVI